MNKPAYPITLRTVTYEMAPLWQTRRRYRCGWIYRMGGWEFWTPDTLNDLYTKANDQCWAIGLPVPPNPKTAVAP